MDAISYYQGKFLLQCVKFREWILKKKKFDCILIDKKVKNL